MSQAMEFFAAMFTNGLGTSASLYGKKTLLFCIVLMVIEWIQQDKQHAFQFGSQGLFKYRIVRWLIYYLTIMSIAHFVGANQSFVYFQF